ncbi:hypothetical protein HKD37_01G000888 [Glycine soja]
MHLADRRNLEGNLKGNLSRRHALSVSSACSTSRVSPSRLSASLALSKNSLTCAKCENGAKRNVEYFIIACLWLDHPYVCTVRGFSIERCIVSLELDRVGLGSLLYNKEKNKMKDCKSTSGEDVSFTSRISQSLTNASQALRTASSSSYGLCRSSHSKISQNSLELGPFSL